MVANCREETRESQTPLFLITTFLAVTPPLNPALFWKLISVLGAYIEPAARPDDVAPALARELHLMARWLELDDVAVAKKGSLARALHVAVRSEAQ